MIFLERKVDAVFLLATLPVGGRQTGDAIAAMLMALAGPGRAVDAPVFWVATPPQSRGCRRAAGQVYLTC